MNKLFCVMGFFLCFSSFCMNNENAAEVGAVKKVAKAITDQRFQFASSFFKAFLFEKKILNANATFSIKEEKYTLLSLYLSGVKSIEANMRNDAVDFGCVLLKESKDQLDDTKYKEHCYIKKNDPRIIDVILSDFLSASFVDDCFLNGYLDVNANFKYAAEQHTLLSLCLSKVKIDSEKDTDNTYDCIEDKFLSESYFRKKLLKASKDQLDDTRYIEHCYIKKDDERIINVALSAINSECFGFACYFLMDCFSNGYLNPNIKLKNGENTYTFFSFYIDVLHSKMEDVRNYRFALGSFLLKEAKDHLTDGDGCFQKNDQRIIDIALSAIKMKCFEFATYFFDSCFVKEYLAPDTTFLIDGIEYTFLSWCLYVFKKDKMEIEKKAFCLVKKLFEAYKGQSSDNRMQGDCYIKKNDQRIIDFTLYAMCSGYCFFGNSFLKCCICHKYVAPDITFTIDGIEYTFFSWCVSYLKDRIKRMQGWSGDIDICDFLFETSNYLIGKKNDLIMIDLLLLAINKKSWVFADHCVMYCLRDKYLDVSEVVEYEDISVTVLSCYLHILKKLPREHSNFSSLRLYNFTAHDIEQKYKNKIIDMMSFLVGNRFYRIAYLLLNEYFINKPLYKKRDEIEHNTLYLLLLLFKEMGMEAVNECGFGPKPIKEDLMNIVLFLAEKKHHGLVCFLLNEILSKKILANRVFSCDIGDGEKKYTFLSLYFISVIKGQEAFCVKRLQVGQTEYFVENCFRIAAGDGVSKQFIEKIQSRQKKSLILMLNNTNPYNLVYQYYKPLCNDLEQYRKTIYKRIDDGCRTCIKIINLMLSYQE